MDWDAIRKEFETTSITMKALAEKYGVKDSTIRSRKNREGWQRNATKKKATQRKNVATKKKKRSGNPNPVKKFTERNQAARKHGLFSRYMPQETLDIMEKVAGSDPADLLWMQIELQFAAIIRAQEIMFVTSKDEMIKELKKRKFEEVGGNMEVSEEEYEFQFAWDRQATFLNAQSRAITELRTSLRQFEEIATLDDERRLKVEQMRLNIAKTKVEVDKISSGDDDKPIEIVIKRKGDRV
jgi:uncharacterized protein YjcR